MLRINLKKLQNGSDIRGIAIEGVLGESVNLNEFTAGLLAKGFVTWLSENTGKSAENLKISIGHDSRISASQLKNTLIQNMTDCGVSVIDCGLSSTPSMFMSTIFPDFTCDGAVMITASHLPYNRNGFKFFNKDGGLNKKDISQIITYAEELEENDANEACNKAVSGTVIQADLIKVYSDFLKDKIKEGINHKTNYEKPLTGLKILVDAGNGAGGFYADKVLAPLGADTSCSQFLEPDGTFPNHIPNPEDKEAMESICRAVIKSKADFGLIFDTDVDRSSAVDKHGNEINRNSIVALASALVAEVHPGTTIVTDSVTSDGLTEFIEQKLGCKHLRFKRGYKNVINESIRLNNEGTDSQLAIETSGHAALKENYFLDDGAYLATKIVIKAAKLAMEGKTLDSLIEDLRQPMESKEFRFAISGENFSEYGDNIISELELFAHVGPGMTVTFPNYEGVRISFDTSNGNGWCLLRKSLHDPIMPMNIESDSPNGCKIISNILYSFLKKYDRLNLTKIEDFIK
ncbi:phosphohexomutase domain-containing protein [Anaerovorax odorimutans]|uniref:phosphoglucomutase n=1 Tax=Anaerovorax odorimutans TaxID=109327 RepID=UPI0004201983|nr:phosphoglucomutase [Anaerovorax odorimutans]